MALNLKPEQQLQVQVFDWLDYLPQVRKYCFSIPNEMKVSIYHGRILKRMGRRSGVCDVFIAYPSKTFPGMFLELKAKGKKPTANQFQFMDDMRQVGYFVEWADNFDDAQRLIKWYLNQ